VLQEFLALLPLGQWRKNTGVQVPKLKRHGAFPIQGIYQFGKGD
jgi:hypothetical protein